MAMAKVHNPAPVGLWIVNGKKGGSMPARRRRKPATRTHSNPRRTTTRRPRRRRTITTSARRRHSNPFFTRRRHHAGRPRRRAARNPGGSGLLAKGFALAASAAGIQFLPGFVPPLGGMSAPADAARTGAVGWLLGMAMRKTGFLARYADDVVLAGLTLAGGKIISSVLVPMAMRFFPQPAPAPAPAAGAGVQGINMIYPALNPYASYGMNGINVLNHADNPYGAYVS